MTGKWMAEKCLRFHNDEISPFARRFFADWFQPRLRSGRQPYYNSMIFTACAVVFAPCVCGICFETAVYEHGKESFMPALGFQELLIIFAILMLLFGARRLPELAKGLGRSVSEFRKGVKEVKQVGDDLKV